MGYKQTSRRGSDNWEGSPQVMVAHKLMAVEVDWRREKETLLREIKRLRSEVGLMTRRCNNSRREIYDMVTRLRAQPPPPVPWRSVDIRVKEAEDNGDVVMKSVESQVKEEQEEQEKKETMPMLEPTPEFVSDPEAVPKFEPEFGPVPNSELESHHSTPKHTPTRTPPAPEKQGEERYRLSRERVLEFGTVIENGGGAAAVDACAERWMLVWMKFCMHLAEDGKDGEAVYGRYKGEQEWDEQVIEWWNGMKDDLRNEMINDGNDMPELIKVAEVDKADRMCWKMKFVKGVNVNLEGNDMVLRVGEV